MKELTKAEEQVMQYLWKIKKRFSEGCCGRISGT
jgi:predicted transcriptional regulator